MGVRLCEGSKVSFSDKYVFVSINEEILVCDVVADLGGPGAPPPSGQFFLNFMQFLEEKMKFYPGAPHSEGWRPPVKILDPPL